MMSGSMVAEHTTGNGLPNFPPSGASEIVVAVDPGCLGKQFIAPGYAISASLNPATSTCCVRAARAAGSVGSGTTAGSYWMLATMALTWVTMAAALGPRTAATMRTGAAWLVPALRASLVGLPGSCQTRTVSAPAAVSGVAHPDNIASSGTPDPGFWPKSAGRPPTVVIVKAGSVDQDSSDCQLL